MENVRELIVKWLNEQQYWIQYAALKLINGEKINSKLIEELDAVFRTADGQSLEKKVDFTSFKKINSGFDTLKVMSIGDIVGIDELAPRSPLLFDEKLSVFYGHNGSGKSGYTRILKKICGKSNAIDLISNVFQAKPKESKCTIKFQVSSEQRTVVWVANSTPINSLLGIDIFDGDSSKLYLENEKESSYVPEEIALFENLITIFEQLKKNLDLESSKLNSTLPPKPKQFEKTTFIEAMYSKVNATSDIMKMSNYFSYTEADFNNEALLDERIKKNPLLLASQKKKTKAHCESLLNAIIDAGKKVDTVSCVNISALKKDWLAKKKNSADAAKFVLSSSTLEGVGTDTWKAMWEAARNYSEDFAYRGKMFPVVADTSSCVFCQQPLSDKAKATLSSFDDYVKSKLEHDSNEAEKKYKDSLRNLVTPPSNELLKASIIASGQDEDLWFPVFADCWKEIAKINTTLFDIEKSEAAVYKFKNENFIDWIANIEKLKKEISMHEKDAIDYNLKLITESLDELRAKKWCSSYVENIKLEIERFKKLEIINKLQKCLSTNGISRKTGEVSEKIITDKYIERFNNELTSLGANKIKVEIIKTRTLKGRVLHKIQLKKVDPSYGKNDLKTLSEGEKRVVLLAAFLADVTGKPFNAPFVFDDPISSMDQSFEQKTAERLIKLSQERQVIVFTHRLSLFSFLREADNVVCRQIRREDWGCGDHGDESLYAKKPISGVSKLKDERLPRAKKIYNLNGREDYNALAKSICSDFRILLERIIEESLLSGIVLRHKYGLTTKDKLKHLAKIQIQDCEYLEKLMSDFSCFEHSQSNENPVEIPLPEVLHDNLDSVVRWHEEFTSRKVPGDLK